MRRDSYSAHWQRAWPRVGVDPPRYAVNAAVYAMARAVQPSTPYTLHILERTFAARCTYLGHTFRLYRESASW